MFVVGGPAALAGPPAWFNAALVAGLEAALPPLLQAALPPLLQAALPPLLAPLRVDIMKSMNRSVTHPQDVIEPVINAAGIAPPVANFPDNLAELLNLSQASSNALLLHYGLLGGGNIQAKRRRLAAHLGVRRQYMN